MTLLDFIQLSCIVCEESSFRFFYCRQHKETEFSTELSGRENNLIGYFSNTNFVIHCDNNTISVDSGGYSFSKFRIMKECVKDHYKTSTNYIKRNLTDNRLIVPDGKLYDYFNFKFNEEDDDRVPFGGGSLNFINNYETNQTLLMTLEGYKKFPLISLNRLNFKSPIDIVDKLESLTVLL